MAEFVLPVIKVGRRRYNCLTWHHDNPADNSGRLRVYFRMHPAIWNWLNENEVAHGMAFWREPSRYVSRDWNYHCHLIIEDPAKAVLFKLTWM